ncbi:hypothetical protein JCM10908_006561 [Rhodotorula pacifica]|uniref:uncharacterized protein n=1 Tax=Rhodotorula pacifica TaxID=1495444 RepID=UPI00317C0ECD
MTDSLDGKKCIVCDEAATLMCDRCMREGHFAIPFCSKEHLELIQPAHSLVCGKNAHPFAIPFQQSEADQIYQLVEGGGAALRGVPAGDQPLYWAMRITCEQKLTGDIRTGLNNLVGVLPTMRGDPFRPLASQDAKTAAMLREWYSFYAADSLAGDHSAAAMIPAFGLSYGSFISGTPDTRFDNDEWHSLFCHRVFAHVPLIRLAVAPDTPHDTRIKAQQLATASLQGARRFVAETDKESYRDFRSVVLMNMEKHLDAL